MAQMQQEFNSAQIRIFPNRLISRIFFLFQLAYLDLNYLVQAG